MPTTQRVLAVNRLLAALPGGDRRRMLAGCESVDLAFAEVLYTPGKRLSHVYFPTSSFISLIMPVDGNAVPRSRAGRQTKACSGFRSRSASTCRRCAPSFRARGRTADGRRALRARTRAQPGAASRDRPLCLRPLSQLAQTAACTRFHVVEARLARWLLMTQDRAHADSFHVTQEFLALMLGVRRVGVTKAASSLQRRRPDPLPPRQHHGSRPARAQGGLLRLLQGGSATRTIGSSAKHRRRVRRVVEIRPLITTSARLLDDRCNAAFEAEGSFATKLPTVPIQRESDSPPFHRSTAQPWLSGPPLSLPLVHLQLGRKPALRGGGCRSGGRHVDRFGEPGPAEYDCSGPVMAEHEHRPECDKLKRRPQRLLLGMVILVAGIRQRADASSVPPLPLPGPYAVACSNVAQDFGRLAPGETWSSTGKGCAAQTARRAMRPTS